MPMLTEVRTHELAKVAIKNNMQIFLTLQNGEPFMADFKSVNDSSVSVYRKKKMLEVKIVDIKKALIKIKAASARLLGSFWVC